MRNFSAGFIMTCVLFSASSCRHVNEFVHGPTSCYEFSSAMHENHTNKYLDGFNRLVNAVCDNNQAVIKEIVDFDKVFENAKLRLRYLDKSPVDIAVISNKAYSKFENEMYRGKQSKYCKMRLASVTHDGLKVVILDSNSAASYSAEFRVASPESNTFKIDDGILDFSYIEIQ